MTTTMGNLNDRDYLAYLTRVQATFDTNTKNSVPLFTTDARGLFEAFIAALPEGERQFHTCNACRRFIERYGGLVTIDSEGVAHSAIWNTSDAPSLYAQPVAAILKIIKNTKVTGVFYSKEHTWGQPVTGEWCHLAVKPETSRVWSKIAQTAGQAMAEKREDHATLARALGTEYTLEQLNTAVTITSSGALYRGSKIQEWAIWLRNLMEVWSNARGEVAKNILWKAVAIAPVGWCKPKGAMIGTLLDDIASGLGIEAIKRRFAEKMNPTVYAQATTAPSAGAIDQAEKLFTALGLEPALNRRFATLDELPDQAFLWVPNTQKPVKERAAGVFANVRKKVVAPAVPTTPVVPTVTMTWEKFQRMVLPSAREIAVRVPNEADHFMALVTATIDEAPPILQWDNADNRNPFSWYYTSGIDAEIRKRLTAAGGKFEDVQVRASLIWNNRNDLDLHCVTPSGERIFYAHKVGRCQGNLDVDRNVQGETMTPVENIRWERAPMGHYQFFVNCYRAHGGYHPITLFRVEFAVNGRIWMAEGVSKREHQGTADGMMVKVGDFTYQGNGAFINHMGGTIQAATEVRQVTAAPNAWGMTPGAFVPVTAVVRSPNLWSEPQLTQHGQHAFFLLDGCKDTRDNGAIGFNVETLKSELRPVRKVIQAHMSDAEVFGVEHAGACGYGISNETTGNVTVRVTSDAGTALYTLDRWD